jgi:predicted metal-dependent hydrolase
MNKKIKSNIVTRRVPFEFPDDIHPHWTPDRPEFAHMWNGLSLTMPYLEPYLIRTMREGLKRVDDPAVLADGFAFIAQEGQHYQVHQRFNDMLKNNGYPELAEIEKEMEKYYARLSKKSLARKMAYSAGFESMTLGAARFIIEERSKNFLNADSRVASFWLWHMVEETEHKNCAYDAYQAACGGYFTRAFGVLHGTWGVFWPGIKAAALMLKKDGLWYSWRSRLSFYKYVASFLKYVLPYITRSMMPGHTPRSEKDSEWVKEWLRSYPSEMTLAEAPLVDTSTPAMPVPKMKFIKIEVNHAVV